MLGIFRYTHKPASSLSLVTLHIELNYYWYSYSWRKKREGNKASRSVVERPGEEAKVLHRYKFSLGRLTQNMVANLKSCTDDVYARKALYSLYSLRFCQTPTAFVSSKIFGMRSENVHIWERKLLRLFFLRLIGGASTAYCFSFWQQEWVSEWASYFTNEKLWGKFRN